MLPLDVLLKLKRWKYDRVEDQMKIAENMNEAAKAFNTAAVAKLGKEGEWK